eukprot:TRINITY_DN1749_c1_g1_i6.p1 TRINITY_DN1749_c1_g1~~TRINITY_DN1749_c1_g1_i6.p1  ORF type:complete len:115 (+),score=6.22 TRINITY_DN1749_c1_g1_i6:117-461(+)
METDPSRTPKTLEVKLDDDTGISGSFILGGEDHTMGNSLRYFLMKDDDVEFCGYSVPHPSQHSVTIRVQTKGKVTAVDAFRKAIHSLRDVSAHLGEIHDAAVQEYVNKKPVAIE